MLVRGLSLTFQWNKELIFGILAAVLERVDRDVQVAAMPECMVRVRGTAVFSLKFFVCLFDCFFCIYFSVRAGENTLECTKK